MSKPIGFSFDLTPEGQRIVEDAAQRLRHGVRGSTRGRVSRHEELPDSVMARLREIKPEPGALWREESVGNLGKDPASVAKRGVGPHRAAMIKVFQDGETLRDDRM